jgi:hypothetical protein
VKFPSSFISKAEIASHRATPATVDIFWGCANVVALAQFGTLEFFIHCTKFGPFQIAYTAQILGTRARCSIKIFDTHQIACTVPRFSTETSQNHNTF